MGALGSEDDVRERKKRSSGEEDDDDDDDATGGCWPRRTESLWRCRRTGVTDIGRGWRANHESGLVRSLVNNRLPYPAFRTFYALDGPK